jgi:mono/diheme cytochrome c family protein
MRIRLKIISVPMLLVSFAMCAQVPPKTPEQLETLIYSVKGPHLFRAHCAACHGENTRGDGPLASALKTKVPDLTMLAKNNKGEFPSAVVRNIIIGEDDLISHGSREMPIWDRSFTRSSRIRIGEM